ncbi:hypothetical protein LMG29660_00420 [Burkholderia puraquae]|uniref:Uncharacterized protein n=1 Tax=Burkholderia puraquae TaxID=1904757 RepID=A0A6J5D3C8_9BURK|nr:hypothetical protein LMG29660_00420 [Burkholderia puraquae]
MSIKNRGQDLKIASVRDGPIVHGGTGHTRKHAVGCIAQADRVQPRRFHPRSCVPAWRTRPSSACRRCRLRSGDVAWPMTTTDSPHPRRRNAGHSHDVPVRHVPDRHAALRGASVGTTGFTRRRDDSPENDRCAWPALCRARASRNAMCDAGRLITACNVRVEDEGAVRRRDTMRLSGGARDYAATGMRCRPFPGISVEITGNRLPSSCRKVVFATD